jgi:hypothetical protein
MQQAQQAPKTTESKPLWALANSVTDSPLDTPRANGMGNATSPASTFYSPPSVLLSCTKPSSFLQQFLAIFSSSLILNFFSD